VLIRGKVLAFPITAMTRDSGDFGDPYPSPSPSTRIPKNLAPVIPDIKPLHRLQNSALPRVAALGAFAKCQWPITKSRNQRILPFVRQFVNDKKCQVSKSRWFHRVS
jgi:hypothetical protein